jgi:shikimate dehydrogenase
MSPEPRLVKGYLRLGLLGYPLAHSLSPQLHQAAMHSAGQAGEYLLYPVAPDAAAWLTGIENLVLKLQRGELDGLNVTIPYKQRVAQWLDDLTPEARAIGAVNVILKHDGKLTGANTDAQGFWEDLNACYREAHAGEGIPLGTALILGAGGAARAVAYALLNHGWNLRVASRRMEQAEQLIQAFAPFKGSRVMEFTPLGSGLSADVDLVVNTTPLGMYPHAGENPWPAGAAIPDMAFIYDLVYNPRETELIRAARQSGLACAGGLGMLVEQAALSYEMWSASPADRAAMRRAVEKCLEK